MSLQDLLSRHLATWEAATRHPFLEGIRKGTLPQAAFERWLVQDYHFVRGLLRAQAFILACAPRADQRVLASGLVALVDELDWFELHAASRGLSLEVEVAPTCARYVDFLLGLRDQPYAVQIVVLWACERAYLDAWTNAAPGAPRYEEFVRRWTQPAFRTYVAELEDAARRALQEAPEAVRRAADQAFRQVAELERDFWDMAWEGG